MNEDQAPLLVASLTSGRPLPNAPDRPMSRSTPSFKREFKVIVIGSAGVGKTCLVKREATGDFDATPQLSMATEKHTTLVELRDESVELSLYDTVGQERFRTISTTIYRNAQAVLLCFDCTNRASFEAIDKWYQDVERNAPADALILLIVTKIDLFAQRVVTSEESRSRAHHLGVHHVETSAKTGQNVKALFALIASALTGDRNRLRSQSSFNAPPSPMLGPIRLDRLTSKRSDGSQSASASVSRKNSGSNNSIILPTPASTATTTGRQSCWSSFSFPLSSSSTPSSTSPAPVQHPRSPTILSSLHKRTNSHGDGDLPNFGQSDLYISVPEDGLSLAEVILEHANQRARAVAGGLRRRNTVDHQDPGMSYSTNSSFKRRDTLLSVAESPLDMDSTNTEFYSGTTTSTPGQTVTNIANNDVEFLRKDDVEDRSSVKLKLQVDETPKKSTFRLCTLGCGAVVDDERLDHEKDECWLRLVPCSLGCGASFPMLDCLAHERENCELRTLRCMCGSRYQAKDIVDHSMSFQGRSISTWQPVDVVHFLLSVFPLERQRKMIHFAKILTDKVDGPMLAKLKSEDELDVIIMHAKDQVKTLESALANFSFISSNSSFELYGAKSSSIPIQPKFSPKEGNDQFPEGKVASSVSSHFDPDYVDWEPQDEIESEATDSRPRKSSLSNNNVRNARSAHGVALNRGNMNVSQLLTTSTARAGLPASLRRSSNLSQMSTDNVNDSNESRVLEVDEDPPQKRDFPFADMWKTWQANAALMMEENDERDTRTNSVGTEDEFAREVLVPLSLGNRTVAVRTIRFKDLELNSMDLVGSGSFGSVYLGRYRGAQVAVKRLHFQDVSERDLLREAALMTSVSGHPHILRFLGVCLEKPNVCSLSEALRFSLEDWLRRDKLNNKEPLDEILRYAEEAASGLYHLHLEMVVHRDIAARNLLLDSGNPKRVKVCDFGLARVLPRRTLNNSFLSTALSSSSLDASSTNLNGLNNPQLAAAPPVNPINQGGSMHLMGPLRWMSPESLRPGNDGLLRFSFASDVYSFAITFWELLSRDLPYSELLPHEAALQVIMSDLRPPRSAMKRQVQVDLTELFDTADNPKCIPQLVNLLERAWDADPVKRPTMKQIVRELTLIREACSKSSLSSSNQL